MNPLQSLIDARLASGPVPAAEVMTLGLYHPEHGYYRRAEGPWGFAGKDYYTALDLGPLLGQTLALRLEAAWERLDRPARFTALEPGAGRGWLGRDVLNAVSGPFAEALVYVHRDDNPAAKHAAEEALAPFLPANRARFVPEAEALEPFVGAVFSNELFCAHFSLFGILSRHVPVDGGISFKYLWYSFQPSDQRPPTAYEHYAKSADLVPGQGYTIHHAAAWFVNGGAVGLVVGGALLGAIWGLLLRWRARAVGPVWITACAALLPLCFVAALPEVIRSGPEAFKALVFEGSLLPLMVLAPAMLFGRRSGRTHNTSRS